MRYTIRDDVSIEDLFPLDAPERSEGLHLSTIYQSIMAELEPAVYGSGKPMDWVRVVAGTVFERALEAVLAAIYLLRFGNIVRPGEFVLDGIIGSPDGLDPVRGILYEFKFTWKSGRHPLTDKRFLIWMIQVKGYLKMLGLTRVTLIVLFVNGEYEKGIFGQPKLVGYDIEFSQDEIDDNWRMVLAHATRKGML